MNKGGSPRENGRKRVALFRYSLDSRGVVSRRVVLLVGARKRKKKKKEKKGRPVSKTRNKSK